MKPEWLKLSKSKRIEILNQVSNLTGLPSVAIEKDWWVTFILKASFELSCSPYLVFKGGTSLSKAWNLIERFSEDIDLALDRKFLGFEGELSKTQISKLRKVSCEYISNDFLKEIQIKIVEYEANSESNIVIQPVTISDKDPQVIEVDYHSVFDTSDYLRQRVLIEIGARSLMEPCSKREINSLIGINIKDQPFSDLPFTVLTVVPKRTFLEKIFLLHEEFSQANEKIRVNRLSRHLYDLEMLMDTEHGKEALKDNELYKSIVYHREKFTPLRGLDYSKHSPDNINIIPHSDIIDAWEKDYSAMTTNMIFGEAKKFSSLIERVQELQGRIRAIKLK